MLGILADQFNIGIALVAVSSILFFLSVIFLLFEKRIYTEPKKGWILHNGMKGLEGVEGMKGMEGMRGLEGVEGFSPSGGVEGSHQQSLSYMNNIIPIINTRKNQHST